MVDVVEQTPEMINDPLWLDIRDITHGKQAGRFFSVSANQIVVHTQVRDLDLTHHVIPLELLIVRDYEENLGDYIELAFKVPTGTFMQHIYPYLHHLEVTLVRQSTLGVGDRVSERFKAVFLKDRNERNFFAQPASEHDLNLNNLYTIRLQLIDRTLEPLRIFGISGSIDKTLVDDSDTQGYKIKDVINSCLSKAATTIEVDGSPSIQAVDIQTPDNEDHQFRGVIPNGTALPDLPLMIQRADGIYLGGVGCYLQNYLGQKTLFVYSLYDSSKIDKQREKLVLFSPKSGAFSMSTKTYSTNGNVAKVLVDPITNIHDIKEALLMSSGSGVRVSSSEAILRKPVELDGETVQSKVHEVVSEFILRERDDGLNYAPTRKGPQKNIFKEVADLKNRHGHRMILVWRQSNAEIIFPGMAFKLLTLSREEQVIELKGVILKVEIQNSTVDQERFTPTREVEMSQTTFLHVFIDDTQDIEKLTVSQGETT